MIQLSTWLIFFLALFILALVNIWQVVETKRSMLDRLRQLERRSWDNPALIACAQTDGYPLPYHGEWAATPDFISPIIRHVRVRQPLKVVELGSGVSTYWLAKSLNLNGIGRLISIDHDADYLSRTREHIEAAGLENCVEFRHSPLTSAPSWYDMAFLSDLEEIDLLIIDGPPLILGADRSKALEFFADRLAVKAEIFVDDARREDERKSFQRILDHDKRLSGTFIENEKGLLHIRKILK